MKKNWFKKFTALLLIAIVTIVPALKVNAAAETITLGSASPTGRYIAGVGFSYKKTTDGQLLFCIDMHRNTAQNTTATLVKNSTVVDGGLTYILKNGYPEKSITGDNDKDYYITQTAVWWYLDEVTGSSNLGEQFKQYGSDAYNLRHYVKELVDAGKANRSTGTTPETKLTIETANTTMTLEGEYYISDYIKATEISDLSSYQVSLTGAPSGTIIEKTTGIASSAFNYNGEFSVDASEKIRIKVPVKSISTSTFSIEVNAKGTGSTRYAAYEYRPADTSMQNVALLEKTRKNVTSSLKLEASTTSVTILKTDSETGQALAGAVLLVKDSKGNEVAKWTTTTNAHIIRNLPNGDYTVEEVSAPTGYKLNKNVFKFTISNSNRNVKIKFENAPKKVVVNITKVDQNGNPLAGAVLVIKDTNGEIIYKFTSSTTSEVITDIDYGTYTVEEISAPEGYIKSDEIVTFTIDAQHQSHQITIENTKSVDVPDTASSSIVMVILGIVITGFGLKFVVKNGQKTK